jgi:hypothetical protein
MRHVTVPLGAIHGSVPVIRLAALDEIDQPKSDAKRASSGKSAKMITHISTHAPIMKKQIRNTHGNSCKDRQESSGAIFPVALTRLT